MRIDRERLLRLATFWLRPDFVLRVVARFQSIAGFDRAIALASSALTAMIPLTIFVGALLGASTADRIITRYNLSGNGAAAVEDAFKPASSVDTRLGILGALLLLLAVLSFARTVQRLFEQTWELPPLSVRNTVNGIKWLGGVVAYFALVGTVHAAIGRGAAELVATVILVPFVVGFLAWSGRLLSAERLAWRDLLPFAIIGSVLLSLYGIGATVYVPHAFDTYAARYGVIGVVFALISTLFGGMVALVGSAALGREVRDELDRIRDGIRPSEDEVRKQWDIVMRSARERRAVARAWVDRHRRTRSRPTSETDAAMASEAAEPPNRDESAPS